MPFFRSWDSNSSKTSYSRSCTQSSKMLNTRRTCTGSWRQAGVADFAPSAFQPFLLIRSGSRTSWEGDWCWSSVESTGWSWRPSRIGSCSRRRSRNTDKTTSPSSLCSWIMLSSWQTSLGNHWWSWRVMILASISTSMPAYWARARTWATTQRWTIRARSVAKALWWSGEATLSSIWTNMMTKQFEMKFL